MSRVMVNSQPRSLTTTLVPQVAYSALHLCRLSKTTMPLGLSGMKALAVAMGVSVRCVPLGSETAMVAYADELHLATWIPPDRMAEALAHGIAHVCRDTWRAGYYRCSGLDCPHYEEQLAATLARVLTMGLGGVVF